MSESSSKCWKTYHEREKHLLQSVPLNVLAKWRKSHWKVVQLCWPTFCCYKVTFFDWMFSKWKYNKCTFHKKCNVLNFISFFFFCYRAIVSLKRLLREGMTFHLGHCLIFFINMWKQLYFILFLVKANNFLCLINIQAKLLFQKNPGILNSKLANSKIIKVS